MARASPLASVGKLHPNRGRRFCRECVGSLPLSCSIAQNSTPRGSVGLPNPLLAMNVRRCTPRSYHLFASSGVWRRLFSSSRCYRRKRWWQPASRGRLRNRIGGDRDRGPLSWPGAMRIIGFLWIHGGFLQYPNLLFHRAATLDHRFWAMATWSAAQRACRSSLSGVACAGVNIRATRDPRRRCKL